jgi:hypothetical protein
MLLRQATALVLIFTCIGCTTVRRVESPREFLNARTPGKMWVSSGDSELTEIQSPRVLTDTIFGFTPGGQPIVYPIAQIRELRTKQLHLPRTLGLVGLFLVGSAAMIAIWQGPEGDAPSVEETEDFRRPRLQIRFPR